MPDWTDEPLPRVVAIPPLSVWGDPPAWSYEHQAWHYLHGTVAALPGVALEIDPALGIPPGSWSAHEIRVDGIVCGFDLGDYCIVPPAAYRYGAWFRYSYTPLFEPVENLASWPITSFLDWNAYARWSAEPYRCEGDRIVCNARSDPAELVRGKHARRSRVRAILADAYPDDADLGWTDLEGYFRRALDSLCVVAVPGTNGHNLDRGPWLAMALGVCVVSPEVFTAPLEERPEPGVHYVRVRDDFGDLIERVEWVREHRDEARAIGAAAKTFFRTHGTPEAIWRYAAHRAQHPRPAGVGASIAWQLGRGE